MADFRLSLWKTLAISVEKEYNKLRNKTIIQGVLIVSYITLEVAEKVAICRFSRPETLNALNQEALVEMGKTLSQVEERDDISVILFTGEGKAFVAGADISEMAQFDPLQAKAFSEKGSAIFGQIRNSKKPTLALIQGYCLGGGLELALSCDFRFASPSALFSFPEVGLGIIPGFGGTQLLPRLLGYSRAFQLIVTGKRLDGTEAHGLGLVNELYEKDKLLQEGIAFAQAIAKQSPVAVAQAKTALRQGENLSLTQALALEQEAFALCFASEAQKKAMTSFLEKKKP